MSADLLLLTGATFSPCGRYRYRLWRERPGGRGVAAFVMLNPSTADEVDNDPTVERCWRRAQAMGFARLEVANIFGLRSTDPAALYAADDPIGPGNDDAIKSACHGAALVVCAWGEHGHLHGRGDAVRSAIGAGAHILGVNRSGQPKHPLYVGYRISPVPWIS